MSMLHRFQFQYGTIKTLTWCISAEIYIYFNSMMVQLKPINGKFTVVSETDFNSMMVQLKLVMLFRNLSTSTIFQFHDGTIKTYLLIP